MGRINTLIEKGSQKRLAMLLAWNSLSHEEKDRLTMINCQRAWKAAPIGSPEKDNIFKTIKLKAKTIQDWAWIWQNADDNSPDKAEAYAVVEARGETFGKLKSVWWVIWSAGSERSIVFKILKSKAKSFQDWAWIWQNAEDNSPDKAEAFNILRSKIKNFKHGCQFLKIIPRNKQSERSKIFEFLKSEAKTDKDWIWIWKNSEQNDPVRAEVLKAIRATEKNIKQWKELSERMYWDGDMMNMILLELRSKAKSFSLWVWIYDRSCYITSLKNINKEAFVMAKESANTFKQWQWVWNNTRVDDPSRTEVFNTLKKKSESY